jgi:hypothetical protein
MVQLKLTCGRLHAVFKPGFHMIVTVVKIKSRSFSSAAIQHFRTENTRSDYNERIVSIYMWFTGINYYKLAVEKNRDSIFTTIIRITNGNQTYGYAKVVQCTSAFTRSRKTKHKNSQFCCG